MEKDSLRTNNNGNNTNHSRDRTGGDGGLLRSSSDTAKQTPSSSDFVLQWGNRKRLRCMKIQVKDDQSGPVHRTTVRVDRRVVRADKDSSNQPSNNNHGNGYFNLRQRPASPQAPPPQRVLRNSENPSAMRGQSNGGVRGLSSPDRGARDKRGGNHNNNNHYSNNDNNHQHNNKSAASSETAHDSKKGGSSSGSGEAVPPVWPPKFVIALTNKEKEEDFLAIKGSKLPQRPKKRAKFIQRTLNLVSPGAWLCDLTLERYEVREKKISKKRPRGLKAMGNMESDSE
ncbi:myb-like protein D [Herrania umbratica]|uniref:Myb-like protein D n=1 Tax=Herrania umbratica TaxID=108875 RepID=A0A6J0ZPQ2_9ROSI|nr:myb-like protein D [Herrania umbratica]XP_021276554.1 myb-like protein D [Herrania umbratica]XP_021276555.1 myb-like protein D [Herrania umbratica]